MTIPLVHSVYLMYVNKASIRTYNKTYERTTKHTNVQQNIRTYNKTLEDTAYIRTFVQPKIKTYKTFKRTAKYSNKRQIIQTYTTSYSNLRQIIQTYNKTLKRTTRH